MISRSSAFAYRGDANLSRIAKELNVAYVLEGSVRKSGQRVRVTAQLIEAATGRHVWSETYDRDLTDIFVIQDEVAGMVADELEVRLLNSGQTKHQTDPETYALYLQARHLFYGQATDRGEQRPCIYSPPHQPQWSKWRKDAGLDEETLAAIEFTIPDFGTE